MTILASEPLTNAPTSYGSFDSFDFDRSVAASASETITFRIRATMAGIFTDYIDVCDPDQNYITAQPVIRIRE